MVSSLRQKGTEIVSTHPDIELFRALIRKLKPQIVNRKANAPRDILGDYFDQVVKVIDTFSKDIDKRYVFDNGMTDTYISLVYQSALPGNPRIENVDKNNNCTLYPIISDSFNPKLKESLQTAYSDGYRKLVARGETISFHRLAQYRLDKEPYRSPIYTGNRSNLGNKKGYKIFLLPEERDINQIGKVLASTIEDLLPLMRSGDREWYERNVQYKNTSGNWTDEYSRKEWANKIIRYSEYLSTLLYMGNENVIMSTVSISNEFIDEGIGTVIVLSKGIIPKEDELQRLARICLPLFQAIHQKEAEYLASEEMQLLGTAVMHEMRNTHTFIKDFARRLIPGDVEPEMQREAGTRVRMQNETAYGSEVSSFEALGYHQEITGALFRWWDGGADTWISSGRFTEEVKHLYQLVPAQKFGSEWKKISELQMSSNIRVDLKSIAKVPEPLLYIIMELIRNAAKHSDIVIVGRPTAVNSFILHINVESTGQSTLAVSIRSGPVKVIKDESGIKRVPGKGYEIIQKVLAKISKDQKGSMTHEITNSEYKVDIEVEIDPDISG